MSLILLLVPLLELLGLLAFVYLASSTFGSNFRYFPLVLVALTVVVLLKREAEIKTSRQLTITAALLSVLAVGAFQLARFFYSGLAKDVDHISLDNVLRLAVVFAVALATHGGLLALCYIFCKYRARV
jgi:hypothetical protein